MTATGLNIAPIKVEKPKNEKLYIFFNQTASKIILEPRKRANKIYNLLIKNIKPSSGTQPCSALLLNYSNCQKIKQP